MEFVNAFVDIPAELKEECEHKGKVEKIFYDTKELDGTPQNKYMFVYTPYGYDETKEYEMLYLIHGGHELPDKYLYLGEEENVLKRIVDNLIDRGEIKPCVICTPTWYPHNEVSDVIESTILTREFNKELKEDIMPLVESRYHTFAKTADDEGFKASRDHRAVVGWSMGSVTTWFLIMKEMAYFNRFGNMSADCFLIDRQGCINYAPETVAALTFDVRRQGFTSKDFTEIACTGTNDPLRLGMIPMVEELKKYPDLFCYEGENRNAAFYLWEGGEHHTPYRLIYTYNILKMLMK